MAVQIEFINQRNDQNRYDSVHHIFERFPQKIRSFVVASAYWDKDTLSALIKHVNNRRLVNQPTRVEVYLNGTRSEERLNQLQRLDRKICSDFTHTNSGIYLLKEGFMHVKAYQIEGAQYGTLIMGSANLTKPGLTKNEEALVEITYKLRSKPRYVIRFEDYIWGHFDEGGRSSHSTMVHVSDYPKKNKDRDISDLREFFSSGSLRYESKAPDPMRIKLALPKALLDSQLPHGIRRLIDAEIQDSLSIRRLIRETIPGSANLIGSEKSSSTTSRWKQWSVETTLGRFVPFQFDNRINSEIVKLEDKTASYANLADVLKRNEERLQTRFLELIGELALRLYRIRGIGDVESSRIWRTTEDEESTDLSTYQEDKITYFRRIWKRDIRRILTKLENHRYVAKLATSVKTCQVPDMWEQEEIRDRFFESFIESVNYAIEINSRNKLAKVAKRFLNDDVNEFENISDFEANCLANNDEFGDGLAEIAEFNR